MAFDECVENPAQHDYSKASCERTTRWLKRCKIEMARLKHEGISVNPDQLLFGINQLHLCGSACGAHEADRRP